MQNDDGDDDDLGAESHKRRPEWLQERRLFGRRRSHKLRTGRQSLVENRLRELDVLPSDWRAGEDVDFVTLFGGAERPLPSPSPLEETTPRHRSPSEATAAVGPAASDVWLEIGFGGGEHLADLARRHPAIGLIGCEHYLDGVGKLLSAIDRDGLHNIRIHAHDARDVIDAAPEGTFGRVYLLYPDPWPKKRHHKRRFINPDTLDALARAMRPGAELRIASDIPDYIRHCLQYALAHPAFTWTAERSTDWLRPWEDWLGTRYEEKALREGRRPAYLRFRRR